MTNTLSELKTSILQKTGLCGSKWVKKVFYKIPIAIVSTGVQYETFVIGSNEDMEVLFHCRRSFLEFWCIRTESSVDDGGGASTSMLVVAAYGLLVEPTSVPPAAARSPGLIPALFGEGEPDHILGDSEEDTPRTPPACRGPSSSGSGQQPPHFSTWNLETKEEVVLSVKDYSIHRGVQYRVMKSDHLKFHGRCKEFGNGCTWLIRITLRQHKGNWEVRRADAAVQEATEETYGFRPSYRKVDEFTRYFHRLFWTFPPCIETFRHYKPLVSIDRTHLYGKYLYGKYGGTLLLAIAQDGNLNILPVAFALVEEENTESWAFFLSHLRQHVTPQEGILVISDRHNGIKAALEATDSSWLTPHAYRAYCIRHVAANFALSFKGQDARRLLVNAAYSKTKAEFDY
ncbi:uncharacterized protein LOC107470832 [Arachis duranensis]|uniref:Uncharacterized protein LOC107470832 n=1 Tax=Arachis duranensis TaxID=130453 RepID=A0A6P4BYG2_ARADU|nr:uncharacterized protein LOC107470832 [Arachis duranensis]